MALPWFRTDWFRTDGSGRMVPDGLFATGSAGTRGGMSEQVPSTTLEEGQPTSGRALRSSIPVGTDALLGEVERIAHLGGFVWTRGDEHVHWSEELYRMLGYDPGH